MQIFRIFVKNCKIFRTEIVAFVQCYTSAPYRHFATWFELPVVCVRGAKAKILGITPIPFKINKGTFKNYVEKLLRVFLPNHIDVFTT